MNYKTPVLRGNYKKGVIIPERNIEGLIKKAGLKLFFLKMKEEKRGEILKNFLACGKTILKLKKQFILLKKNGKDGHQKLGS